ncbi:MAG: Rrf2 family transcriptional regulator [candidate division Zixibacteria bacterium]|nr:Rrf2 family transcriptional regulator [candidate division Zixibacteria bacterium]
MVLSKSCIYGIRAALLIALKEQNEGKRYVPIRELAEELSLSFHFLTKILQGLTEEKMLHSYRGPNGGVGLAKPAGQIRIIDIVTAIDGGELFAECLLGFPGCGEETPCPMHESWAHHRDGLKKTFEQATLAGLARDVTAQNLRK